MDTFTDDVIFTLSLYLVPKELVNLALVCKRFGYNYDTSKKKKSIVSKQQQDYPWSLMEEASRRRISAAKNDIQNPYRHSDLITIRGEESWIAVHQRLHLLQHSLVFSKLIGTSRYVNDDITHVNMRRSTAGYKSIAVCNQVMKSGFHSVEFHVTEDAEDGGFSIGLIDASIHNWPKKKMRRSELSSWCTALRGTHDEDRTTQFGLYIRVHKGDILRTGLDVNEGWFTIHRNNELIHNGEAGELNNVDNHCWALFEHGTCRIGKVYNIQQKSTHVGEQKE